MQQKQTRIRRQAAAAPATVGGRSLVGLYSRPIGLEGRAQRSVGNGRQVLWQVLWHRQKVFAKKVGEVLVWCGVVVGRSFRELSFGKDSSASASASASAVRVYGVLLDESCPSE